MKAVIEAGTILECPLCGTCRVFGRTITDEDFPLELQCGVIKGGDVCRFNKLYYSAEELPPVPKFVGKLNPLLEQWKVNFSEEAAKAAEKDKQEQWLMDQLGQMSFRVKTNMLGEQLLASLELVEHLKACVSELGTQIAADLEEHWARFNAITELRKGEITRFILQPITSLELMHEDETMNRMSCIAVAPSFYDRQLGVPIRSTDSYHLWAINPYTQITFPVESWLAEILKIEQPWELSVAGNKVIGPDLPQVFESIPGVSADHDHDNSNPSIKITGGSARVWLAKNGVCPWPKVETVETYDGSSYEETELEPWGRTAWENLQAFGRIGLCGKPDHLRRFCRVVLSMMRRSKAIIVPDNSSFAEHWNANIGLGKVVSNVAYVQRKELAVGKLNAIDTVVIDPELEQDSELSAELLNFKGHLIYCREKSLTDCTAENVEDSMFFANVATMHFPMERKARCRLSYKDLHLAAVLDDM